MGRSGGRTTHWNPVSGSAGPPMSMGMPMHMAMAPQKKGCGACCVVCTILTILVVVAGAVLGFLYWNGTIFGGEKTETTVTDTPVVVSGSNTNTTRPSKRPTTYRCSKCRWTSQDKREYLQHERVAHVAKKQLPKKKKPFKRPITYLKPAVKPAKEPASFARENPPDKKGFEWIGFWFCTSWGNRKNGCWGMWKGQEKGNSSFGKEWKARGGLMLDGKKLGVKQTKLRGSAGATRYCLICGYGRGLSHVDNAARDATIRKLQ